MVHYKPGKRLLRLPARSTVLGGGLLERARSTTLALLGVTAAFGLCMVALALNQSWPLLADSPIPAAPAGDAAVDEATVVSRASRHRAGARAGTADRPRQGGRRAGAKVPGPGTAPAGSVAGGPSRLVVAPSTPVDSGGSGRADSPAAEKPEPSPAPAAKSPAPTPAPAPAPSSAAPSAPSPPPTPEPTEAPSSGPTAAGAQPEESGPPSWSNGDGHAYGRSKSEWGGHDDGWDGRGHDRGHGHHWDD